ncbi:hypothetical protein FrEUN1fDRAFT_2786 [Parafrankia sp. EUN1f]|nr:hypothetical protein FrEUN1fDRAFT_2786 [Parafrankia sp. EUN1f]
MEQLNTAARPSLGLCDRWSIITGGTPVPIPGPYDRHSTVVAKASKQGK